MAEAHDELDGQAGDRVGSTGGDRAEHQSLYRRFRPQRFAEVVGQEHVTVPLRNAVRQGRVSHAYLFSGPRGTGKTSTARILAKALNCTDLDDGEPCGRCPSCREITRGTSLDVHELDAASNNGVDAMRDLVSRAALSTPGRSKVYIVDEVHMLSTAASNALLKTLEEPPPHVVFVLATTDPHKVLPTIRSRTQPFEFRLLGPESLDGLLRSVRDAAGLPLDDAAVAAAVRRGRGSARDALSVLDQVAAGGLVEDASGVLDELAGALAEQDTRRALEAVARAVAAGYDPQRLSTDLADLLRQAFLSAVAPGTVTAPPTDRPRLAGLAERLGLPGVVRAMERLGTAQVAMRDAPDPRAHLEVVLARLTSPELDDSLAALLERVDRLERQLVRSAPAGPVGAPAEPTASPSPAPHTAAPPPVRPPLPRVDAGGGAPAPTGGSPLGSRPTLGVLRRRAGGQGAGAREPASAPAGGPTAADATDRPPRLEPAAPASPAGVSGAGAVGTPTDGAAGGAGFPSRDALVEAWGDVVLAALPSRARARFRVGRFVAVADGAAHFALPNETHRRYCEEVRPDVEQALSAHFGCRVPLVLVVDTDADPTAAGSRPSTSPPGPQTSGPVDPAADDHDELLDPERLAEETAPAHPAASVADRLKRAFPGAEEA